MEEQINIFNDDKLIRLIKEEFNENDNHLFELSFKLFNTTHNKPNDYIIDLDNIWKWIGFSRKSDAKKLLITNYKEETDSLWLAVDVFSSVAKSVNYQFSKPLFVSWILEIQEGTRDSNGRKTDLIIMK